ncbi:hypothetical protein JI435_410460 [Parastagonospora nodorum SN15]|uniref:Uncharacterized protein n=1 Tax=Phaeosphaeria nodorum (strain SN15 / ATCC MYA-4574 / FGSC 10173) TaxID=321614 RepID=A0A7U2F250_PHANO|nr:hypothetical protein JI435_410460 [Parastagonospora nodorum SN15]
MIPNSAIPYTVPLERSKRALHRGSTRVEPFRCTRRNL